MIIRSCWPELLRQLCSSLFFLSVCHACLLCLFVGCLSSSAAGRGIIFFFPFCVFLRHPLLTPSVTLFLPSVLESPATSIHPLHLSLHSLAFLPVRAALRHTETIVSTWTSVYWEVIVWLYYISQHNSGHPLKRLLQLLLGCQRFEMRQFFKTRFYINCTSEEVY